MSHSFGGRTLLVVVDDKALQRTWADALTAAGFIVLTERDPAWAARTFAQRPIDLVVAALRLPGRSGLDLVGQLRGQQRGTTLPVVLVASLAELNRQDRPLEEVTARLGGTGRLEWLDHPFEPARLVAACQRLLDLEEETTNTEVRRRRLARARLEVRKLDLSSIADLVEARSVESESQVRYKGAQLVRGQLRETPIAEVLGQLHRWRATGSLLLRSGPVKKFVHLKEGAPVFVRSNLLAECLGHVLVREKMISLTECEESLARMKAARRQQGTVLIEMGCISPSNLAYALQLQLETKLFDLFYWSDGDYHFNPRAETPPSLVAFESTSARLLLEGVQRACDKARVEEGLGRLAGLGALDAQTLLSQVDELVVRLSDDPLDRFQEMGLDAEHARLYSLIDGRRTVGDLLAAKLLFDEEALRLLYALRCANMIQLVQPRAAGSQPRPRPAPHPHAATAAQAAAPGAPPATPAAAAAPAARRAGAVGEAGSRKAGATAAPLPERALPASELALRRQVERLAARAQDLRRGTYYDALGLAPDAGEDALHTAWAASAREFHPDRLGSDASAEARAISEEIFASIVQAYEVLSDAEQRRAYDADLSQGSVHSDSDDVARILAAEEQFRRGDALLRGGQAVPALRALQEAVRLYPDEAEFHACLGWAEWLCSRRDETGAFVADGSLRRALELNPRMDRAYVFRGWILQALVRPREAEAEFENALLCNPACGEALRELRLTGAP